MVFNGFRGRFYAENRKSFKGLGPAMSIDLYILKEGSERTSGLRRAIGTFAAGFG